MCPGRWQQGAQTAVDARGTRSCASRRNDSGGARAPRQCSAPHLASGAASWCCWCAMNSWSPAGPGRGGTSFGMPPAQVGQASDTAPAKGVHAPSQRQPPSRHRQQEQTFGRAGRQLESVDALSDRSEPARRVDPSPSRQMFLPAKSFFRPSLAGHAQSREPSRVYATLGLPLTGRRRP